MNCSDEGVCGPSEPVAGPEYVWDEFNQLYRISDGKLIKQSDPYYDFYMDLMQQGFHYNPAEYFPGVEAAMPDIQLPTGQAVEQDTESRIAMESETAAERGQASDLEAAKTYRTTITPGTVWNSESMEKTGNAQTPGAATESGTVSESATSGKTGTAQSFASSKETEIGRRLEAPVKTGPASNCDVSFIKSGTSRDSEVASRKSEIAGMMINGKKLVRVESALEFLNSSSPKLTLNKVSETDSGNGATFTKSLSELSRALKTSSRTAKLNKLIPKYPLNAVSSATVQSLAKRLSKISKGDVKNAGPELFVLSRKGTEAGKEGEEEKAKEGGSDSGPGQGYLLFRLHSSNDEEDGSSTTAATITSTPTTKGSTTSGSTASSSGSSSDSNDNDDNAVKKDRMIKKRHKSKKNLTTEDSSEYDDEYDDDSDTDDDYSYYDYDDDYDYDDYSDSSSPRLPPGPRKGLKVLSSSSETTNPGPKRTTRKRVRHHPVEKLGTEESVLPPRVPATIQVVSEESSGYNRSNKNANNYLMNPAVHFEGQEASSPAEYVDSEEEAATDQSQDAAFSSCVEDTALMPTEPEECNEDDGWRDVPEESDVQSYYDRMMTQNPVYDPQGDSRMIQNLVYDHQDDRRMTQNPVYDPQDDRTMSQNLVYDPPGDRRMTHNLVYDPQDDRRMTLNPVYQPQNDRRMTQNLVYDPPDDRRMIQNPVYDPQDDRRMTQNPVYDSQDDRRMIQNLVYDPQDDRRMTHNPVYPPQEWQWQRSELYYNETAPTRSPETYERYEMQPYQDGSGGIYCRKAVYMDREEEAMRMAQGQSVELEEEGSMGTAEEESMRMAELEARSANDSHSVEFLDGRRSTEFVEITAKAIAFADGKYEIVDVDVVPLKPFRHGPTQDQRVKCSSSRSGPASRTKRSRRRASSSKRIPMTSSNETTITQNVTTASLLPLAPSQIHAQICYSGSQQYDVTRKINDAPLQTTGNDVIVDKVNDVTQRTTSATQTEVMSDVENRSVTGVAETPKVTAPAKSPEAAATAQKEVTSRDSSTQTRTYTGDCPHHHHHVTCAASVPCRSPLRHRHPLNRPSAYLCPSPIPPRHVPSAPSLAAHLPLRSTCDQVQQTDRLEPDPSSSHLVKYGNYVYSLYQQDQLTDVVLKAGIECFYAHRSVLACHSRYFASLFTQDLATSSSSSSGPSSSGLTPDILEINDISPAILKKIIEYIYTGRIVLHQSFLLDILMAASKLELQQLETNCIKKLNALNPQDLLDVMISAYKQGITAESDLIDKLWRRIACHFKTVIRTKQFLQMNVDCICRLLSDDDLVLTSEIDVAQAAIRWINEDREMRVPVAGKVLACVRFKNLTPDELVSFGRLESYILSDPAVKDAILEANWYHTCQLGRTDTGMMSSMGPHTRQKSELRAMAYNAELSAHPFIVPSENWRN